jgi:hypothetical protein
MLRNTLIAFSKAYSWGYSRGTNIRKESSENGYNRVNNAVFRYFFFSLVTVMRDIHFGTCCSEFVE